YEIYRSEASEEDYEKIADSGMNTFVDGTVEANQLYYYRIGAVDLAGNISEFSEEVSVMAGEFITLFGTDFEEDDGGFVIGVTSGSNNPWEWGVPTSGPNVAASGDKLWATNLSGNYTTNT